VQGLKNNLSNLKFNFVLVWIHIEMSLEEKIDSLSSKFDSVLSRLDQLEETQAQTNHSATSNVSESHEYGTSNQRVTSQAHEQDEPVLVSNSDASVNAQRIFDGIKESYSKTKLPPSYKVNDLANGIKTECRPVLKVISRTARFAETGLKVIACMQENDVPDERVNELYNIFKAQINFLQAEYSNLVVRSTFDEDTSRIFRQFENNSQALNERSLANIRVAAEIASLQQRQQRNQRATGRGESGFRGRSSYRGFPSNRGSSWNQGGRGGFQPRGRMEYPSGSGGFPQHE